MKRFKGMIWAAVAVLGLYSPTFSEAAGPFGSGGSKGGMARGGSSGQSRTSGSSFRSTPSASSFKSTPSSGGLNRSSFKSPALRSSGLNSNLSKTPIKTPISNPIIGSRPGKSPITALPGNTLPPISKLPGTRIPGNAGPIRNPGLVNGDFGGLTPLPSPTTGRNETVPAPGVINRPYKKDFRHSLPSKDPLDDFYLGGIGGGNNPPGGGNNPPGGGNNPPGNGNNPPGGGNNPPGGGNGGHDGGHDHGHRHHWGRFPNYCLNWYCPPYFAQPYCGTVFLNGGWTYVTQPVAVEQIGLVQAGEALPEIPSAATFRMQVAGLGPSQGMAAVEVNGVGMQAELLEWNGDSVVVRLPSVGLTQPLVSQLYILQSDGSMAKDLKFKMLPAMENAVAAN